MKSNEQVFLKWVDINIKNLTHKVIALNGATGGIGSSVATYLSYLNNDLILLVRNLKEGNKLKNKLEDNNVKLETFFDLLAYIMANYNEWLLNSKNYNADINNRYIDILYYIAYGMIIGFNKVILAINKRVIRKSATLSVKEINRIFSNDLQPRKAFNIVKNGSRSLAVIMAETSNDSIYMNITSNLEDQNWSLAS